MAGLWIPSSLWSLLRSPPTHHWCLYWRLWALWTRWWLNAAVIRYLGLILQPQPLKGTAMVKSYPHNIQYMSMTSILIDNSDSLRCVQWQRIWDSTLQPAMYVWNTLVRANGVELTEQNLTFCYAPESTYSVLCTYVRTYAHAHTAMHSHFWWAHFLL